MGRHSERSASRIGSTAAQLADLLGPHLRAASETLGPALDSARHQLPQVAEAVGGRLAANVQPMADGARDRVGEVIEQARERSGAIAEQVVQAAYEVSKSLPPDARRVVEQSLRKTGVQPPRPPRRRHRRRWVAAAVLAGAGVAFLFSGTLQDKVYDIVDRLQGRSGEDDEDEWTTGPLVSPGSRATSTDAVARPEPLTSDEFGAGSPD